MANTPESILRLMARMTDEAFLKWAEEFGYTPAPDPINESVSNFRMRVLESLDRLSDFIDVMQSG